MSYRRPQEQFFRQTLTYEEIVKQQITKCLAVISENDLRGSQAAIRGLVGLVTPKMSDDPYLEQMQQLDLDWKEESRKKDRIYRKELKEAQGGCPDLIGKPDDMPGQQYWEDAFGICLGLFERRGLLMKFQVEDTV